MKPVPSVCSRVRGGAFAALFLVSAAPAAAALTEGPRLAAIYDTILAANFDQARLDLTRACPPAPAEACAALSVISLWWQIALEPDSRALDERLETAAREAIAASTAWTEREPRRAEAWFYLAAAHAPLVQLRALRRERLSAARDAAKIKAALEQALALDPALHDAHFGIGLYRYYADVAPLGAKILRVLLLLPGGDKAGGLRGMLQARDRGVLVRGEADYQLHWLYLWYEGQPARALELVRGLDARYPSNPIFLERAARVEHEYFHDHRASAASWQTAIDRAQAERIRGGRLAEARARLGLAAELIELADLAQAAEQIDRVIDMRPPEPYASRALALRRQLLTK